MGAGGSSKFQNIKFACLRLGKSKLVYWEKGKSWPVLKKTSLYGQTEHIQPQKSRLPSWYS